MVKSILASGANGVWAGCGFFVTIGDFFAFFTFRWSFVGIFEIAIETFDASVFNGITKTVVGVFAVLWWGGTANALSRGFVEIITGFTGIAV